MFDIESISFTTLAGEEHFLVVDGYDEAEGDYILEVDCICSGDTETPTDWTDCSERTEETCESDNNCRAVTGRPAAADNSCFEPDPVVYAGCASQNSSICARTTVQVIDDDGLCWEVSRACHIPLGFHSVSGVTCPTSEDTCSEI